MRRGTTSNSPALPNRFTLRSLTSQMLTIGEHFGRDQEVNDVRIPGPFEGFAEGEGRLAETSDIADDWIVRDPTPINRLYRQRDNRL